MTDHLHKKGAATAETARRRDPQESTPMSTSTVHETTSTVERLRALADWLTAHPAAEPSSVSCDGGECRFLQCVGDAEALATTALAIGGRWEKTGQQDSDYFNLRQEVLPGVFYEIFTRRENVCERVIVGTETVEEPAPGAPMIEVEREIIEWRCPPSLLALTGEERA